MKFPWKKPACATCKNPIASPDDAMAQWRRRGDVLDMPEINCKSGGCAARFWTERVDRRTGMLTQDLPAKWLRASPVEAIGIVVDAIKSGQPEDPWIQWIVDILGLPLTTVADAMMDRRG